MDYSFLKLYNSINDSISDNTYKNSELLYFTSIVLDPNETYLQLTSYEGGLSFSGNYQAAIIDKCSNVLKNITENIFIQEFINEEGNTQNAIEIVNINEDFYGNAVFIRLYHTISDTYYYTRPIKITSDLDNTYRFDYTNSSNLYKIPYENADFTQSIRLDCKFLNFDNQSDSDEYFQISNGNTISSRLLKKISNTYLLEDTDSFVFERLQKVFEHDTIYLDNERITNNPIVESDERKGNTNRFDCQFKAFINKEDTFTFSYQVFEGIAIQELYPENNGNYTLTTLQDKLTCQFNTDINIETGTLTIYNSNGTVLQSFTQDDMFEDDEATFQIPDLDTIITQNGTYYILFDAGLISSALFGIDFEGISDPNKWRFTVGNPDYSSSDYSDDYFIN